MNNSRVKSVALRIQRELKWPATISIRPGIEQTKAYSEVANERHDIAYPPAKHPRRDIDFLHAVLRAHLTETVSPLFALSRIEELDHPLVRVVVLAASEWFVIARARVLCQTEEGLEQFGISQKFKDYSSGESEGDYLPFVTAIATLKLHYRPQMNIVKHECAFRSMILALLKAPDEATHDSLVSVANSLLSLVNCGQVFSVHGRWLHAGKQELMGDLEGNDDVMRDGATVGDAV